MACRGPLAQNTLLFKVVEAVFQLRKTPFPGPSVTSIWNEFQRLYPGVSTLQDVERALRAGAKRGTFFKCEYPSFSRVYYYAFNPGMVYRNWANRAFSVPAITDENRSGSGYPCGCRNGPLAFLCPMKGSQGGNYEPCCPNPPSPMNLPSLSSTRQDTRDLSCCQPPLQ